MRSRALLLGFLALGAAGCRSTPAAEPPPAAVPVQPPLAPLSSTQVLLLPVRFLGLGAAPWADSVGDAATYLRALDRELASSLERRAAGRGWIYPDEIARLARRSAGFAPDPYTIAAERLRGEIRPAMNLVEPLASQLRGLIALRDARYVVLPVELRLEALPDGRGRAVLRVAVVDARLSRISWHGEVASDPADTFTPAIAASVADHFVDLFAAR